MKIFNHWRKTVIEILKQISLKREFHNFYAIDMKNLSQIATHQASDDGITQSSALADEYNGQVGLYRSRHSLRYEGPGFNRALNFDLFLGTANTLVN